MKFLVDEYLRPIVANGPAEAGHDVIHVGDVGLQSATDEQVMSLALERSRIVVSADTDFGELLARDRLGLPSVILLRRNHDPADQVRTILAALADVADDLLAGAIVGIVEDRRGSGDFRSAGGDRAVRAATALARSSSQVAVADRPPWGHRGLGSERSRIATPAGSKNSVKTRPWEHSLRMTVILSRSAGSHG